MILRVYAMARPARSILERSLVREAVEGVRGSARARAASLARRVVAETIAYVDRDPCDELTAALTHAEAVIAPSPAFLLATMPEIDTASALLDARARRFRDRGCRQLDPVAWAAETRAIRAELVEVLARRYRAHLTAKKVAVNRVLGQTDRAAA